MPTNIPLQTHPNIANVLPRQPEQVNDGWGENPVQPPLGVANWPTNKLPLLSSTMHGTPPAHASENSFVQPQKLVNLKSTPSKQAANEIGKQQVSASSSEMSKSSLPNVVRSGSKVVWAEGETRGNISAKAKGETKGDISFLDMHPEISHE